MNESVHVFSRTSLLGHGELLSPQISKLLPANSYHFNPSIILWDNAIWMIYRSVTPQPNVPLFKWPRTVALCRFKSDLQPDLASNVDISKRIQAKYDHKAWHADPRFFIQKDCPWISYHNNKDLFLFSLTPEKLKDQFVPRSLQLTDRAPRTRERNWGFFYDGSFKAVYSIHPHVILLLNDLCDKIEVCTFSQTEVAIPWNINRWGDPHGGSPPIHVGSCWFSFFHSNIKQRFYSKKKVYRMGFYGFDDKPPHRIRFMSKQPILEANHISGPLSFYRDHSVVFPSGALFDRGWWLVSLGIHDRTIAFATFEHKQLLKDCQAF